MNNSSSALAPAVALVPGFFGFDHRGDTTYFADRFVAGLRSVLEAKGVTGVPVLSISTLGIAGLQKRQRDLLCELRALETPGPDSRRLGGPRAWHLVGHSTGGVDAALLLRENPLLQSRTRARDETGATRFDRGGWGEWADLVGRIRSVTTLSAPHFGTRLAESPLARFAAGHPSFAALWDLVRAATAVAHRGDLGSRLGFAISATPSLAKMPYFLVQMALMNDLADDLRPEVMVPLSSRPVRAGMEGQVFSVATLAPRPGEDHPDRLFRDMWRWTRNGHGHPSMARPRADAPGRAELDDLAQRLPTQRRISLPPIDDGDNDGIVSTESQVFGKLLGVVIGDHVDVLGRYRRASLVDGKVIDPGLLTSGAEFGDDEFFALLLRIGERIAGVIREE